MAMTLTLPKEEDFERCGHAVVRGVVPAATLQMLRAYCLNYAKSEMAKTDAFVPGAPSGYGHPCMERLLQQFLPVVEAVTSRTLFPTYSYFRVYRQGDVLRRHVDRPACEISFSVCLGYTGVDDWPLWVSGPEGVTAASLRPGDGVVYKGIEIEHWRDPLAGESAAQVFLHYVDRDGPYAEWRFDKRAGLRLSGA